MTRRAPRNTRQSPNRHATRPWRGLRLLLRWAGRGVLAIAALVITAALLFSVVNPPMGLYMRSEATRLGGISRDWVALDEMSQHLPRSVVAAEDANFCLHWGFDMAAIRTAIDEGRGRGASTISQQVVKNVFLWQGRSWPRKALEALMTPVAEAAWSKRRMLEIYLNVAEFDEGIFGAQAAARRYFGKPARDLSAIEAARLAAVLPDPKGRNAARPSAWLRARAARIADGAATIVADGRAACFES
ncbi:MAG: monofunctional biosynthetic peptidoglycan transglycosylase [Alphaproteobacteria bacterium HGW-Alphaproteobacteria-2]|nr:MAG: monofunctional biosynthetic peptidoglycan transglycosylase [Alphaproteobacteria bacterium HGW-Alphaproteobacteria-2]